MAASGFGGRHSTGSPHLHSAISEGCLRLGNLQGHSCPRLEHHLLHWLCSNQAMGGPLYKGRRMKTVDQVSEFPSWPMGAVWSHLILPSGRMGTCMSMFRLDSPFFFFSAYRLMTSCRPSSPRACYVLHLHGDVNPSYRTGRKDACIYSPGPIFPYLLLDCLLIVPPCRIYCPCL
jgi:hypothetical protein